MNVEPAQQDYIHTVDVTHLEHITNLMNFRVKVMLGGSAQQQVLALDLIACVLNEIQVLMNTFGVAMAKLLHSPIIHQPTVQIEVKNGHSAAVSIVMPC